jgi:hypothetical protein
VKSKLHKLCARLRNGSCPRESALALIPVTHVQTARAHATLPRFGTCIGCGDPSTSHGCRRCRRQPLSKRGH